MNIFNILQDSAKQWPTKTAIVNGPIEISYSELERKAQALNLELQKHGVGARMATAILFPNGIEFIVALMSAAGTGSVVMPIHHLQKENEIKEALREGQMHFLLSSKPIVFLKDVSHLKGEILIENCKYYLYTTERKQDDNTAGFIKNPAFMRFTSGTTGASKGVFISHKCVIERIDAANSGLQLTERDVVLWVLPMAYHFVVSLVLFLKYGVTIVVNTRFLAHEMLENMAKYDVTFFYGAPMHIKLLGAYKDEFKLPRLKKVVSTTTAISATICHQFYKKYQVPVSQAYGIIEIGLPILNKWESSENPEAVGYGLPAYSIGILDENYNEVADGTSGLLGIKGPGMFSGYLTPPTLKKDVLKNNWFITGDIAVRNVSGLITVKGRKKSVINVSGNKVFPTEVEDVVNRYEGVKTCRAFRKEHPLLGEIVALDVVLADGLTMDKEDIIAYSRKYLSDFKVPQAVRFVDALEMTASGKIKR